MKLAQWQTKVDKGLKAYVIILGIKEYFDETCKNIEGVFNIIFMEEIKDFGVIQNCAKVLIQLAKEASDYQDNDKEY